MMKILPAVLAAAVAPMLALSGCSGTGSALNAGSTLSPSGVSAPIGSAQTIAPERARKLVYVSDQLQKAVLAFPAGERANNPAPVQVLNFGVIPEGVWVDRNGILYVALSGQTPSQVGKVEEFKPGATSPFLTITDGISVPKSLVVDTNGTLYVDQIFNLAVQIQEYPAGKTSPSTTLQVSDKGEPVAGGLTLDAGGNVYLHAFFVDDPPSRVYRFAPGKTTGKDLQLSGLGDATGLTSDAQGNLYVSDSAAGISVYAPGKTKPTREIAPPSNDYFADFVATRTGKLYVAQENPDPPASSLLEYAVGGSQPTNVLSGNLQAPVDAALRAAAF
jgi:sugar lactone lactonase YvrE